MGEKTEQMKADIAAGKFTAKGLAAKYGVSRQAVQQHAQRMQACLLKRRTVPTATRISRQILMEALRGRTTREAAAVLGVSMATVYHLTQHHGVALPSKERRAAALSLLREGRTISETASLLGLTWRGVRYMATKAGITPEKGCAGRHTTRHYPEHIREEALRRVKQGETQSSVARALGVHVVTVGVWVRAARRKEGR